MNRGFISVLTALIIGTVSLITAGGVYTVVKINNLEKENERISEALVEQKETNKQEMISEVVSTATEVAVDEISTTTEPKTDLPNTAIVQPVSYEVIEPKLTEDVLIPTSPTIDYRPLCTSEADKVYTQKLTALEKSTKEKKAILKIRIVELDKLIRETEEDEKRLITETRESYDVMISREEEYYRKKEAGAAMAGITSGNAMYSPESHALAIKEITGERDVIIGDLEKQKEKDIALIKDEAASIITDYKAEKKGYEVLVKSDFEQIIEDEALLAKNEHYQTCLVNNQ